MGQGASDFYPAIVRPTSTATSRRPTATRSISTSSGLGLPDRDYYLKPEFAQQREAYAAYAEQVAVADRLGRPGERDRGAGRRLRNHDRRGQLGQGQAARPDHPVQSGDSRPNCSARAGFRLERISRRREARRSRPLHRRPARRVHAPRRDVRLGAAGHGQGMDGVPRRRPGRALSVAPVRQRPFRFPWQDVAGQAAQSARWKRAMLAVAGGDCGADPGSCFGTFNWGVGELYSERYFPAETKARDRSAGRRRQGGLPPSPRDSSTG